MSWTLIMTLVAMGVFFAYTIVTDIVLGVPSSLSTTFYIMNEKKKGLGWIFSIMMFIVGVCLMPAWIEISAGSNWQFLAFFTCACIVGVGAAPAFRSCKMESVVHVILATSAAIFALAWQFAVPNTWWIVFLSGAICYGIGAWTKTIKTCANYWLEMIAFLSTFLSVIYKYFV